MRDAGLVVADILEAIDAAREASLARSYKAFCEDRLARLATERALEIISEAARRLPDEIIERHPEIEWVKIKAIGNILRHEYHRIAPKNRVGSRSIRIGRIGAGPDRRATTEDGPGITFSI